MTQLLFPHQDLLHMRWVHLGEVMHVARKDRVAVQATQAAENLDMTLLRT